MVFEQPRHQSIAQLLLALDAALLRRHGCLFGGGTAMAMRFGEYRESVDVDFLVSDAAGYRQLRELLHGQASLAPLLRDGLPTPELLREIRADQYGIRTRVDVAGTPIKLEIVREARFALDRPSTDDVVCGVATLSRTDMATSKLLANSDRGADDSTFNRDVIDLAMLAPQRGELLPALTKAELAYGRAIRRDLNRSVAGLRDREGWLDRCVQHLAIRVPKATLWQRVRDLARRIDRLPPTEV